LKQISGIPMSMAGALHAQGAAIVNPYPVTVALRDKVIAARMLAAAGAPMPVTYVVSQPDLYAPVGPGTARRQAIRRHLRVGRARRPHRGRAPRRGTPVAQAATRSGTALSPARGARLEDLRDRRAALRRPEGLPGHHGGGEVRRAVRPDCR